MHEPLVLGLTLPLASVPPWIFREHTRVLDLVRTLRAVWTSVSGHKQDILHELCALLSALEALW